MAHKLHSKLDDADAEMLKRSTQTIVNQVHAMKTMVNEFSEYARSPTPQLECLDLNKLISDVVSLYGLLGTQANGSKIKLDLEKRDCSIKGDGTMLRQV